MTGEFRDAVSLCPVRQLHEIIDRPIRQIFGPPPTDRLAPGRGVVRWSELFQLLARKNYRGFLSYEAPNPAHWQKPAIETAREGADAARRALATAFAG